MIVKVNSESINIPIDGLATMGDLLEKIKTDNFTSREFISSIVINGNFISEEQQGEMLAKPVSDSDNVELTTDNPVDLSVRTLSRMDELVDALVSLLNDSSDKFRVDDETVANQHFLKSVEALQTFVEVIMKIKTLNNLDYSEIIYNSEPVSVMEDSILRIFNSLHDTQKSKDWISLADVIEFELVPMIKDWKEVFPLVSDSIKKLPN